MTQSRGAGQDRTDDTMRWCRLGFGWSTSLETIDRPWTNRTPAAIAAQLRYALIDGIDPYYKRGVFWSKTIIDSNNKSSVVEERVRPPFILVGHSAGALYVRQFAHDYPELGESLKGMRGGRQAARHACIPHAARMQAERVRGQMDGWMDGGREGGREGGRGG